MRRPRLRALLAAASLALCPAALHGQAVRGRVVDAEAGRPAAGAIVSLLHADGRRLAPALVGEDGAYLVAAPAPGSYRVRVDLIGYETWLSAPLALAARDTAALDVRLPLKRVRLAAVRVEGENRCEARPQQAPRTLALWEEIRRALTISEISERRRLVPLDLLVAEERLVDRRVVGRTQRRTRGGGARPWGVRSPAAVAAQGFVVRDGDSYEYIGPDVPILLSPQFLETHCFRPVQRARLFGTDGVGLAFEPVPGRDLPDVKGTIWLDAETSELRRVEFEFVELPSAVRRLGAAGGRLEFARQPFGAWYVRRWEIQRGQWMGGRAFIQRTVGEALPVGAAASRLAAATLHGIVVDSTVGEGLAGALVLVPGVEPAVTDSLGRFAVTVPDLPDDSLDAVVTVDHPRLATLGLASVEHTVRLRAGQPTTLGVAIPSVPTLLGALCPLDGASPVDARGALRVGMLVGRATNADGAPLPDGARVIVGWPSDERLGEGVAARMEQRALALPADGRFRLCPLPIGRTLELHVEVDGVAGPGTELVLPAFGIGQVDLVAHPGPAAGR